MPETKSPEWMTKSPRRSSDGESICARTTSDAGPSRCARPDPAPASTKTLVDCVLRRVNIYEIRSGPEQMRWFWALHFPGRPENQRTDNRAGSLEAARSNSKSAGDSWKAWAKLEEVP